MIASKSAPANDIDRLWRNRPRSRLVFWSLTLFLLFLAAAWMLGDFSLGDAFSERRLENLGRFLGDLRPHPLQNREWDGGVAVEWVASVLSDRGLEAALTTLAISVLAILLAALLSAGPSFLAARNMASPEPLLPSGRKPTRAARLGWTTITAVTRLTLILLRSLPEYILAFLLLAILGPTAWVPVLALAIHNAGILGKLNAETIENASPASLSALRALGAPRLQIGAIGLVPQILSRYLLYFFYRWETCVREATILGMLGVVSLGYWITDARTRGQLDIFVLLILLGALIVLLGDLVSALARRVVRRAS